jgi:hypothetical protein
MYNKGTKNEREVNKMLKKMLVVLVVVIAVVGAWQSGEPKVVDTYEQQGVVSYCDNTGHVVVVDNNGEMWEMTNVHGLQAGDKIVVVFNDNDTTEIYDDEIMSIRKI